jgi:hypothetical protein
MNDIQTNNCNELNESYLVSHGTVCRKGPKSPPRFDQSKSAGRPVQIITRFIS